MATKIILWFNKCKAIITNIKELKEKLKKYEEMEDTMKKSIYQSEITGNDIKKQAIEEAKVIVSDAKRNASRIVNDALLRSEKIELKADTLERNTRIFKKSLIFH